VLSRMPRLPVRLLPASVLCSPLLLDHAGFSPALLRRDEASTSSKIWFNGVSVSRRSPLALGASVAHQIVRATTDRARDLELAGTHGIDQVMKAQPLDAILFPGASGAFRAAKPGDPTVIVPLSGVPNTQVGPFPPGFDPKPAPFGVSFTGVACSDLVHDDKRAGIHRRSHRRHLQSVRPCSGVTRRSVLLEPQHCVRNVRGFEFRDLLRR